MEPGKQSPAARATGWCAALLAAGCCATSGEPAAAPATLRSQVIPHAQAEASQLTDVHDPRQVIADLHRYCEAGATPSLRDLLTIAITLHPGQQLHPPHQHAEEEFLWIASGSGEWHLDGREFPAAAGDLLYTEPWVMHGITNTGREPLTFFVVKWNGNGMPVPPPPASPARD